MTNCENKLGIPSRIEACKSTLDARHKRHMTERPKDDDARIAEASNRIKKAIQESVSKGKDWCEVYVTDLYEWTPNYVDLFDELEKLGYSVDTITDINDRTQTIFVFWDLDTYLNEAK